MSSPTCTKTILPNQEGSGLPWKKRSLRYRKCPSVKGVSKSIKTQGFIEVVWSQIVRFQWERIKNKKEREEKKKRPFTYQSFLPPPLRAHLWKIQRIQNNHKYKRPDRYLVCTTSDPSRELQRTLPLWCLGSFACNSSCCKVPYWKHHPQTPSLNINLSDKREEVQENADT